MESLPPSTPVAPALPARAPSACRGAGGLPSARLGTRRKVGVACQHGVHMGRCRDPCRRAVVRAPAAKVGANLNFRNSWDRILQVWGGCAYHSTLCCLSQEVNEAADVLAQAPNPSTQRQRWNSLSLRPTWTPRAT